MKNKKVNLNDICFFQEGPGVRKHQYCTKGVKLINVSNLVNGEIDLSNSNRYISQEEAYGRYKHFLIDEGDLIIASSGIKVEYLDKKIAFIKKENLPLCMNTSTIRFKVKNKNELDILYLSYFLKSKNFKNQISKLITGSAQLNFGGSHLKKINLFLPELNVQKKVSTLLLLIDNTIKDMQRKLSILEQLTKSLFTKYSIGEKESIANLCYVKARIGWQGLTKKEYLSNGEYYLITGVDFKNEKIDFKNCFYVTKERYNQDENIKVKINDILLTKDGTIGKVAIVDKLEKPATLNSGVFVLRPKVNNLNVTYLMHSLISEDFKKFIDDIKIGATVPHLNQAALLKYKLILPPIELQNKFAERIEKIEKLKFTIMTIILKNYETMKKKGVEKD